MPLPLRSIDVSSRSVFVLPAYRAGPLERREDCQLLSRRRLSRRHEVCSWSSFLLFFPACPLVYRL